LNPSILARHEGLLVVNKPAGWVVHAARPEEPYDLRAWLAKMNPGVEPIHRLDRETSGIVLFAADPAVRATAGTWFAEGKVHKAYVALVQGRAHAKGVIRRPLLPDNGGAPQEALTRYRVIEALGAWTLLRVAPETGRKHQVRRHLAGIGLPIVGDERHGPKRFRPVPGFPERLWLHAERLELPDGTTLEAPLPEELATHLALLRAGRAEA
jgi:tRNA pseudouridine32 synthase/23S rRNA pseudouridine746 synthase/23S rRNA pseudouridine955/2504/2580 synthase